MRQRSRQGRHLPDPAWQDIDRRVANDDQFFCACSVRGARAVNGRSSAEQGPQDRKDNDMIAALVIAWFAVVGLVLIARVDYRRPLTR